MLNWKKAPAEYTQKSSTNILGFHQLHFKRFSVQIFYFQNIGHTLPKPKAFVGVLTEMNMRSASWIALSMSVEKNKFRPRHSFTTSSRPGCNKPHNVNKCCYRDRSGRYRDQSCSYLWKPIWSLWRPIM